MKRVQDRLRWYKNRLAAMSGREIAWRIEEALRRKKDGLGAESLIATFRDYGPLPEIPDLRSTLESWQVPDSLLQQWAEDAELAHTHAFVLLGQIWPKTTQNDIWHLDPYSKTLWPRDAFCFAIDYRHGSNKGDIKFVWEVNRLQYLQPVAALAFKRRDKELALFCLSEIESWIDTNPPFKGVNWNSGIELVLRVISLLTVTTLTQEYMSRATRGQNMGLP